MLDKKRQTKTQEENIYNDFLTDCSEEGFETETEIDVDNLAQRRCIAAGYTLEQTKRYKEAMKNKDKELLLTLPCACYPGYLCPVHHILNLVDIYNPKWKPGGEK